MVAIKTYPNVSLDSAVRLMHPFPIFERYVEHDIIIPSTDGKSSPKVIIKGNTQVVMFTNDFLSSNFHWNIFGAGPRICAGMHLALPFLKILHQIFLPLISTTTAVTNEACTIEYQSFTNCIEFSPEKYHRYSGRNNDGKTNIHEIYYFIRH